MKVAQTALAVILVMQGGRAEIGRDITLHLPHPLVSGESVWLTLKVGAIGRSELHVSTPEGRELGTITTYGVRAGRAAGVYTLPIPADAASHGLLSVRLTILSGGTARAATQQDVSEVKLSVHPEVK